MLAKCPALCLHRRGSVLAAVTQEQQHLSSVLCSLGLRSKNRNTVWSRVQSAGRPDEGEMLIRNRNDFRVLWEHKPSRDKVLKEDRKHQVQKRMTGRRA